MNNAITQAVSAESNSIKLEVSGTYATKNDISNLQIGGVNRFIKSTATTNKYITATGTITDGGNYWDLTDYINVSKWTHYIASGWTNLGNAPATCFYDSNKKFISGVAGNNTSARYSLPIPTGAAYMRFSYAHVDTDKLKIEKGTKATDYSPAPEDVNAKFNNYATTASLTAYIAKTDTGALKSCIEAIADTINITARGGLNISGNRFTLASTNTTITADGSINCKSLKCSNAEITGGSINVNTSEKRSSYMTLNYGNYVGSYSPYQTKHSDGTYSTTLWAQNLGFYLNNRELAAYDYNGVYLMHDDYQTSLTKNLRLSDGDCYVYGYYYISSGGAWVELSEWIKQKLGI